MKDKLIAVLMGGWNAEREVSLHSGEEVYRSLVMAGYLAVKLDFTRDIVSELEEVKPDIIFNALHGRHGEDGCIQGLLNILNIPYTHSGVTASAICMDKILNRKICATVGVKSPAYEILKKGEIEQNNNKIAKIGKPFVIKPINEGSSVGIEVILQDKPFNFNDYKWEYGDEIIIEKYCAGQEIEVAVIDGKALGAIEIKPKNLFYDYQCKYTSGMTDYVMPAKISPEKYAEVLDLAEKCYKVVGCEGIGRVDFILNNSDGEFYLLESNTNPGFTSTSLVPKIANHVGISFTELVEFLVKTANCK